MIGKGSEVAKVEPFRQRVTLKRQFSSGASPVVAFRTSPGLTELDFGLACVGLMRMFGANSQEV